MVWCWGYCHYQAVHGTVNYLTYPHNTTPPHPRHQQITRQTPRVVDVPQTVGEVAASVLEQLPSPILTVRGICLGLNGGWVRCRKTGCREVDRWADSRLDRRVKFSKRWTT